MDNNTPTTELSVEKIAENYVEFNNEFNKYRSQEAYYAAGQCAYIAGYNYRNQEVEALLKVMDNLPKWLTDAANILDFKADQIGKESILSPKLTWYAEKITDILTKYNK